MTRALPPAPPRPLDLWRRGVTLADAAAATPAGRRWALDDAADRQDWSRLRTDPRSPLMDRAATTDRLQRMAARHEGLQATLESARDHLRGLLHRGELFALGFVVPAEPTGAARLAAVPPAAWGPDARVDWPASGLTAGAITWRDVRVLPAPVAALAAPPGGLTNQDHRWR